MKAEKECTARCWLILFLVVAMLAPPASGQEKSAPAINAQTGSEALPQGAIHTIQDALEALEKSGPGKSAPARPLGDPADFFGADAYPPEAAKAQEQGRSVVRVEIDARGFPTGCTVISSSDSAALDAATCRIAQTRMQYAAARDVKGKPVASQYTLPVRWMLPRSEDVRLDITDGRKGLIDVTLEIGLDSGGRVTSCKVVEQHPPEADSCSGYPIGKPTVFRARRNGEDSPSRMTIVNRLYLDQP